MFDHTATVYSKTETIEAGTRARRNAYTAGDVEECAIVSKRFGVRDAGAGRTNEGETTVYLRAGATLARGYVLNVTAGPNAPIQLEVVSFERPRDNHTEATVKPFNGSLA